MHKLAVVFLSLSFLFASCNSNKPAETERMTIASQQGDCVGVAPMKCMLVKKEGSNDWEFMYNQIEGFNYEPGYEYVVEVKTEKIENPAADQSAYRYILVKEISRKQKASDNLPM